MSQDRMAKWLVAHTSQRVLYLLTCALVLVMFALMILIGLFALRNAVDLMMEWFFHVPDENDPAWLNLLMLFFHSWLGIRIYLGWREGRTVVREWKEDRRGVQ